MTRRQQSLGVALVGLALLGVWGSTLARASADHAGARAEWSQMSARLLANEPGYDAQRSDILYEESDAALARVRRSAPIAAAGLMLLLVGATSLLGGRRTPKMMDGASDFRVLLATVVDAAIVGGGWVGLGWLLYEVEPTPLGTALHAAIPILVLTVVASPLSAGASPGQWLMRTRALTRSGTRPYALQTLLASVLVPAAGLFAFLALLSPPLRHDALVGPHLAAAGLVTHRLRPRFRWGKTR